MCVLFSLSLSLSLGSTGELEYVCVPVTGSAAAVAERVRRLEAMAARTHGVLHTRTLRAAGLDPVCFTQRAGELVAVPPWCFRQRVRRSGPGARACCVAWLQHTPQTLCDALALALDRWRRAQQTPPLDYKALVVQAARKVCSSLPPPPLMPFSLQSRAWVCATVTTDDDECLQTETNTQRLETPRGAHHPPSDYELLHRTLTAMCNEEWVDFGVLQGDRVWARVLRSLTEPPRTAHRGTARYPPPPDPRAVQQVLDAMLPHDPVSDAVAPTATPTAAAVTAAGAAAAAAAAATANAPPQVLCTRCNSLIFSRYYTCCECDADAARAVYCLRCVLEGSRCDHIKSLRVHRVRRLAPLRALAAALATHGARAPPPPPPLFPEPDRDKVSLATACFMLVGTAKEDLLVTCHQCKLSKPIHAAMCCRNVTEDCSHRKHTVRKCTKKYCWSCLWNRYALQPADCLTQKRWVCPSCRGMCNCKACLRKREGSGTSGHRRPQGSLADSQSPDKRPCTNDPAAAADARGTAQQTPESSCSLSNSDDASRSSGPELSPSETPSFLSPRERHEPEQAKPAQPVVASANENGDPPSAKQPDSAAKTGPGYRGPPITHFMARVGPFSCEYLARVCQFSALH